MGGLCRTIQNLWSGARYVSTEEDSVFSLSPRLRPQSASNAIWHPRSCVRGHREIPPPSLCNSRQRNKIVHLQGFQFQYCEKLIRRDKISCLPKGQGDLNRSEIRLSLVIISHRLSLLISSLRLHKHGIDHFVDTPRMTKKYDFLPYRDDNPTFLSAGQLGDHRCQPLGLLPGNFP